MSLQLSSGELWVQHDDGSQIKVQIQGSAPIDNITCIDRDGREKRYLLVSCVVSTASSNALSRYGREDLILEEIKEKLVKLRCVLEVINSETKTFTHHLKYSVS